MNLKADSVQRFVRHFSFIESTENETYNIILTDNSTLYFEWAIPIITFKEHVFEEDWGKLTKEQCVG